MPPRLPPTRSALIALAALQLTACGGADGPLSPSDEVEVLVAQARWAQQRPAHYRYESTVGCFCPPEFTQAIVAEVRNGVVVATRYANGQPTPFPSARLPIDSLFAQILKPGDHVERVEATFDARYGYPRQFRYVPKPTIADGEYSVTITRFEPLP